MILNENRLLADDSLEISYLIFFQKLGQMSQNLSSAAVVIGALRVNMSDDGIVIFGYLWQVRTVKVQTCNLSAKAQCRQMPR